MKGNTHLYIHTCIKTQGNALCGPRSQHTTPMSYNRKYNNAIFIHTQLRDTSTKPTDFCSGNTGQCHHLTLQISTKVFLWYEPLKIGWVSLFFILVFFLFFFFLSNNKSCHKMQTHYLIILKFGTQQNGVRAHCGIKFGRNNVNGHKVINNYSWKIIPICCHTTG